MDSTAKGGRDRLQEIIDFAAEREQEAADFYTDMAARLRAESLASEVRAIAAMEVQHRDWLRKLDLAGASVGEPRKAPGMGIAEHLVEQHPGHVLTWQDILNIAMHRELSSMNLYRELAELVSDTTARQLFQRLADEEQAHKLFFEKLWDQDILIEG